jgi:hypothetical protein
MIVPELTISGAIMGVFKNFCRDVAAIPKILTFSDIAKAASSGAASWQNTPGGAWVGAILGVSIEASKRALEVSTGLMSKANPGQGGVTGSATTSVPKPKIGKP